jgi:hypothetical protein
LPDDIPDRKDGVDLVELVSLEIEFFAHARDVGIVEVRAVEIVGKVAETAEGEDEGVELAEEFAFARDALFAEDVREEFGWHCDGCLPRKIEGLPKQVDRMRSDSSEIDGCRRRVALVLQNDR